MAIKRGVISAADNKRRVAEVYFRDADNVSPEIPYVDSLPSLSPGDRVVVAIGGSLSDAVIIAGIGIKGEEKKEERYWEPVVPETGYELLYSEDGDIIMGEVIS